MRHIFLLPILLSTPCFAAPAANDLSAVNLESTGAYDPRQEQGRLFKEFFSGLGVMMAGPSTDLGKTISDKLALDALHKYFPDPAERTRIAQKISSTVQSRFLANGYSNENVNAAMKYATDQLVATIVPRVLQAEGVSDPSRGTAWSAKILAPFDRCMSLTRSYVEGKKCGDALEGDLVKNVGLAMTFELSRQEFGKDVAAQRVPEYNHCLLAGKPGADSRVRDCAVKSLRAGASALGRSRVLSVASQKMPLPTAQKIAGSVMPDFDKCLGGASDRTGFEKCADKLISTAGAAVVNEAILDDKRVASYFPDPAARSQLASSGRDSFTRCMADNDKNNRRDSSGTLLIDNCQNFVTMETSRSVAGAVFKNTLTANLPGASAAERASALKKSNDQLAACWDSSKPEKDNAACLRKTAKQMATDLAGKRIDSQLPADARDPKLEAKLVAGFSACLDRRLPADLLTTDGADTAASLCANDTMKSAALIVAEAKVRSALQGKLDNPAAVDKLVNEYVRSDFADCLGDNPTSALLASCSLKLQKYVAYSAAQALVPAKIDLFLNQGGGAAAFNIDAAGRQNLIDAAVAEQKQCLRSQVKSLVPDETMTQINGCFKTTVRDVALSLGSLELTKEAKLNGIDVTTGSFAQTSKDFTSAFAGCLDGKKAASFSLDDYLKGLDGCQGEMTKTFTTQLAKSEFSGIAKDVLGPSAADLQKKLFADFDKCMAFAGSTPAVSKCVNDFKSKAMIALAKAGVRARAAKETGSDEPPPELADLDRTLDTCVLKGSADDCSVDYVKNSTKVIGHLVLKSQLEGQLGPDRVAPLAGDVKDLEKPFGQCVDSVPPPLGQKMLAGISACGDQLTQGALDFMMAHMADGAAPAIVATDAILTPVTDPGLADMITRTFLCLNNSLGEDQSRALTNLEPGSLEDKLLSLIGSYVNYDVKNAHGQYQEVLDQVGSELKAAGPAAARRKLLGLLVQKGMTDQLIKGMLKSDLERSLAALPADKKLSPALAAKLTSNATLDAALGDDVMAKLRPEMGAGVLTPVLVDGQSMQSTAVLRVFHAVRTEALDTLLASNAFAGDDAAQVRQALKH
ncbi:MAG: hypothetical protein ACXWR1_12765 [Bdellovibrionota bacterium]